MDISYLFLIYFSNINFHYLLALKFAQVRKTITDAQVSEMLKDIQKLPQQIELLLNNKDHIQRFANRYLAAQSVFFIGRGIDYSIKNNIYPKVEVIPIQQINEAYKNVLDGKVQFRYVIDMASLK